MKTFNIHKIINLYAININFTIIKYINIVLTFNINNNNNKNIRSKEIFR